MSARTEARIRYRIVPARPEDAGDLAALVNSAYRGDSSRKGWTTEADFLGGQRTSPEALGEEIERGAREGKRVILCLREATPPAERTRPESRLAPILACVSLERTSDNGCYLGMLTVSPERQAGGIGRALLESAENFARTEWSAKRMILGVIQLRSELIAWYERRGYRATGEIKPFPYGNEAFGLPRRPDLHFVMFEKPL